MEAETTGIIISTAVATKALDVALAWVKAKFMKGNEPHQIQQVNDCVTVKECNRRMKDLDDRVTRLEQKFDSSVEKIISKLDTMDREGEKRSVDIHRRLDGVVEKVAETRGEVGLIKDKMFKRK